MKQFLGARLSDVIRTQEIVTDEEKGSVIHVCGPLADVFAAALNEHLKKPEEANAVVAAESFTDPEVLQHYLIEESRKREGTENPLIVYAVDRNELTEEDVLNASIAATQVENPDEFFVVNDHVKDPIKKGTEVASQSTLEIEYLETALETLVERLGGHYVSNSSRLKAVLESYNG